MHFQLFTTSKLARLKILDSRLKMDGYGALEEKSDGKTG